jgi:uncharacterized protein
MSRDFPDWINPWSAAEGRRIFEGTVPLQRMQRLSGLLSGPGEDARFSADFALDNERRPVIELDVSAELPLTCQASLETYLQPVTRHTVLGVVASPAEYEMLPSHYEPVLVEEGRMALLELVEDELLLGLPQVPRRPDLDTVQWRSAGAPELRQEPAPTRRPFAGLGALLGAQGKPGKPE